MLHGGVSSIGCIAVGDPAVEVLFKAVTACGPERAAMFIAPQRQWPVHIQVAWISGIHEGLFPAIDAAAR